MVQVNMIILKHIKQDVKSMIDLVLDKDLTVVDGIFQEDLDKKFVKITSEKHSFRIEQHQLIHQNGDLTMLELMKCLRKKHWLLMTSHSFMHLTLEKTLESHFYFERIIDPNPQHQPMSTGTAVLPAGGGQHHAIGGIQHGQTMLQQQRQKQLDHEQTAAPVSTFTSPTKSEESEGDKKSMPSPEVVALILDKTNPQSGPYGFAKRSTLLTAQHPRLKREAGLEGQEAEKVAVGAATVASKSPVPTPSPSITAAPPGVPPSPANRFGTLRSTGSNYNLHGNANTGTPATTQSTENTGSTANKSNSFLQRTGAFEQKPANSSTPLFNKNAAEPVVPGSAVSKIGSRFGQPQPQQQSREPSVVTLPSNEVSPVPTPSATPSLPPNVKDNEAQAPTKSNVSFSSQVIAGTPPPQQPLTSSTQGVIRSALKSSSQPTVTETPSSPAAAATVKPFSSSINISSSSGELSPQKGSVSSSAASPMTPAGSTAPTGKPEETSNNSNRPPTPNSHTKLMSKYGGYMKKVHLDNSGAVSPSPAPTVSTEVPKTESQAVEENHVPPAPPAAATSVPAVASVPEDSPVAPAVVPVVSASVPIPAPEKVEEKKPEIPPTVEVEVTAPIVKNSSSVPLISSSAAIETESVSSTAAAAPVVASAAPAVSAAAVHQSATRKSISMLFNDPIDGLEQVPSVTQSHTTQVPQVTPSPPMPVPAVSISVPTTVPPTPTPIAVEKVEHPIPATAVATPAKSPEAPVVSTPLKSTAPAAATSVTPVVEKKHEEDEKAKKPALSTTSRLLNRFIPRRKSIGTKAPEVVPSDGRESLDSSSAPSDTSVDDHHATAESIVMTPSKPSFELAAMNQSKNEIPLASERRPSQTDVKPSVPPPAAPMIPQEAPVVNIPAPTVAPTPVPVPTPIAETSIPASTTVETSVPSPPNVQTTQVLPPPPEPPVEKEKDKEKSSFSMSSFMGSTSSTTNKNEKAEKLESAHKSQPEIPEYSPAIKGDDENFNVDYQIKSDIPRAIFSSPSTKDVDQEHESNKLNHYSKLGSAFATNALRTGGAGRGRGRGRGIQ